MTPPDESERETKAGSVWRIALVLNLIGIIPGLTGSGLLLARMPATAALFMGSSATIFGLFMWGTATGWSALSHTGIRLAPWIIPTTLWAWIHLSAWTYSLVTLFQYHSQTNGRDYLEDRTPWTLAFILNILGLIPGVMGLGFILVRPYWKAAAMMVGSLVAGMFLLLASVRLLLESAWFGSASAGLALVALLVAIVYSLAGGHSLSSTRWDPPTETTPRPE